MNETLDLVPRYQEVSVRAEDFLPLMSVDQAVARKRQINEFISKVLVEGEDYGKMPGGQQKKVLMKPGAEKLCSIFGLAPRYEGEEITEDWTGEKYHGEPLFYYRYRCRLYRGDKFMGEAVGSCNSWEVKYRYRWVSAEQLPAGVDLSQYVSKGSKRTLFEFMFAFDKRETTGQYGKPEEHWLMFEKAVADGTARKATRTTKKGEQVGWEIDVDQTVYRIPNPDCADVVNTCQKMAQKRALVAAVLIVTNCSDAFTQDLEEEERETPSHPVADQQPQAKATSSAMPKELSGALAAIDKNVKAFPTACDSLYKLMCDKAGSAGAKAYDEIAMKFSEKHEGGCTDKEQLKRCILDLWEAYQKVQPVQGSGDELFAKEPA